MTVEEHKDLRACRPVPMSVLLLCIGPRKKKRTIPHFCGIMKSLGSLSVNAIRLCPILVLAAVASFIMGSLTPPPLPTLVSFFVPSLP